MANLAEWHLPRSACSSSVRGEETTDLREGFTVMQITHQDRGYPLGAFLPFIH